MVNWKYVKPLQSEGLINEFESLVNYSFSDEFIDCVKHFNGGRPEFREFNTNKSAGRVLKSFLSFNRDDKETVWVVNEWNNEELANSFVAFATDHFGNLICFDKNNDNIIFLDKEDFSVELIANSFPEFIVILHEEQMD